LAALFARCTFDVMVASTQVIVLDEEEKVVEKDEIKGRVIGGSMQRPKKVKLLFILCYVCC
jgi:hypothetical protein